MRELAWTFQRQLPLLEGLVVETLGRPMFVGLGTEQTIKNNMERILFHEVEKIKDSETGRVLGPRLQCLGQAWVKAVLGEELSQALLFGPTRSERCRGG